ncbi:MAG: DUF2281 domain-containing protein [Cyanobacteria bacterium J06626_18]
MPSIEELQKDIQALPEEAQSLLVDFIELLKKRYSTPAQPEATPEKSAYQKFKESGFIGCVAVEENLSITYKQALSEKLSAKCDCSS